MSGANNNRVSKMFDLADCGYMEGVAGIYAVNENNELVPVEHGDYERDNGFPDDSPVVTATLPLFAGT